MLKIGNVIITGAADAKVRLATLDAGWKLV